MKVGVLKMVVLDMVFGFIEMERLDLCHHATVQKARQLLGC